MSILFAASEIFPYAKSGGLADVAHALPQALRQNKEKVYSVMPLYNIIDRKKYGIEYAGLTFEYWLCGVRHQFDVFHKKDSKDELFIFNPILCDRLGLYNDEFGDFGDNGLRFGLFSYAVLEVMIRLKLDIKTIHVNDWQTALVPLLAKTRYKLNIKTVLTIHNLAYQGVFPKSLMDDLELTWEEVFKFNGLEFFDNVNLLKGGIYYADEVTTVSESYAKEIQTANFGNGLDETLRINSHKLKGIVNGISTIEFDPKTDKNIPYQFSLEDYEGKQKNKSQLLKKLNLEDENKALFVFIGRFTSQKGIDLLLESLNLFKTYEANFVFLGNGEEFYNEAFSHNINKHKNIHIHIGYDESLARQLYASADFLMMPSVFEPCGLNQMICMRYGCLPLVSKTGGLKDTVIDFTDVNEIENSSLGIGISYIEHNLFWFNHAITKAFSLYSNKQKFIEVSKQNMKTDNSWAHSAKEYIKLYNS